MIDVIYEFFLIIIDMITQIFNIQIPFSGSSKISLGAFIIAILTIGTIIGFVMQYMGGHSTGGRNLNE